MFWMSTESNVRNAATVKPEGKPDAPASTEGAEARGQGQGVRAGRRLARQRACADLRRAGRGWGQVEFVGVYDTVAETAQRFAQKHRRPRLRLRGRGGGGQRRGEHRHAHYHAFRAGQGAAPAGPARAGREAHDGQRRPGRRTGPARAAEAIASCRSATSSGSIPSSTTWRASPPTRASSRRTACRLTRRAARTSAWCWT